MNFEFHMTGSMSTVVMAKSIKPRILCQGACASASPASNKIVESPTMTNTVDVHTLLHCLLNAIHTKILHNKEHKSMTAMMVGRIQFPCENNPAVS